MAFFANCISDIVRDVIPGKRYELRGSGRTLSVVTKYKGGCWSEGRMIPWDKISETLNIDPQDVDPLKAIMCRDFNDVIVTKEEELILRLKYAQ